MRSGQLLDLWMHGHRPTDVAFDREGRVYLSDLWRRVGQSLFTNGPIRHDLPGDMQEDAHTFQKFAHH